MAVAAGLAMLRYLKAHPEVYRIIEERTELLATAAPEGMTVNRVGSMITFFFTDQPVTDYESAKTSNTKQFGRFFHALLERGIYWPPAQFEAAFISAAHSQEDIEQTVAVMRECFEQTRIM
jgi:glutamate-1-semialdehyde 2,1-aminomutase